MKKHSLLFTLLLALMVPLAALAQVERTVTVYNGIAKNSHIPFEGWSHGSNQQFESWFTVSQDELVDAGLVGKPIKKMAFYLASSSNYTNYNYYRITIYNDYQDAVEVVQYNKPHYNDHGVDGVMAFYFTRYYTYNGQGDLRVRIWSPMAYETTFPDHLPQFYGVNLPGVENGYGTHGNGFSPKITFTYQDEATWANTNRPQDLSLTVGSDGTSLGLSWHRGDDFNATFQVCCVPRGSDPSNWVTSQNTLSHTFTGLIPNTDYDLYVRARQSAYIYSNPAKAMCTTKRIATNLDEGDLELDFDEGFISNGIACTGVNNYMLDVIRETIYSSYFLDYSGTAEIIVNLPQINFSNAINGVIMEFDLRNTENLLVQYCSNYNGVSDLGTFSASSNTQHYSVRFMGQQNASNAYFNLVASQPFSITNIVIYKAPSTMKPYNIQASNITTNSATITWDDDNTGNVTYYMRYRKSGTENWSTNQSAITQSGYELTGLDTYSQYEVQMMAYRNSTDYSDYTESFVFATACPATETSYSQSFTNLSALPSYWRIEMGEYNEYSVSNDRLIVRNNSYEVTTWGTTFTEYAKLDAYVILPYFENLATLQLSFKAGRTAGSYNELVVGVMSDPFDASTFSTLETRILNGPTTTYNYSLANAVPQHGYIAIRLNHYEYNPQSVWFDDFMVTRYAAPTNLTVSDETTTSVTLGWTSIASEWEIRYGTDANSFGNPITVTQPTYTITGLTANTGYTAQVRAKYGDNLYSEWADFGTFKTLMQAAVVMNAENASYYEDFESDSHGWILNNGGSTNYWCRSFGAGELAQMMPQNGNKSIYITDGTTTGTSVGQRPAWKYTKMNENQFQNIARPSLVYLTKIFNLSAGQYTFNFDYKVMGNEGEDYLRVFLLPADMELNGAGSSNFPDGYQNWYYLDDGTQVARTPSNNSPTTAFVSFGGGTNLNNVVEVIPGGAIEPGNYMMVFAWRNTGTTNGLTNNPTQYPAAIDNVSVTWSPIIYAPGMALQGTTDTEATLSLIAPGLGIAPTSYEVQYIPELDYNNNNGYDGAPIATFNVTETPQTVTLTGLTPNTGYCVRIRSVYTANGISIYSNWENMGLSFTTKWPRPTNLALVEKTTSWANVMWTPVEMDLPSSQSIRYEYQLTTNPENWDVPTINIRNNSCPQNFAPGTYYIHVRTYVEEYTGTQLLPMGESEWTEPISFTIEPWTEPVSVFPLTYGFDEGLNRFADGITLGGDITLFNIVRYDNHQLPAHGGGESTYALAFGSDSPCESHLAFPPVYPSNGNGDLLVSFWWYHDNAETNNNVGVTIEYSYDGTTWQSAGDKIIRFADETGWVKYQQVVNADSSPTYVRLHFEGPDSYRPWDYCFLDDLDVYAFKSEQPYISYVDPSGNSAAITLYDYAVENGYHSSQFEVQYREWRDPSETQEEWVTYPAFVNQEPYTFENYLVVNGLQSTTLYEFRARARVSYGGNDFEWSGYCEPYRQWTDCGTYIITPTYSYTMDFEDEFYYNCWSGDIDETAWHVTTDDAHSGTKSFYIDHSVTGTTNLKELLTPQIDLTQLYASTDNVVLRFWVKYTSTSNHATMVPTSSVNVYNGSSTVYQLCQIPLNTDGWTQIELSLSKQMGNVVTVGFKTASRSHVIWYIDDIEIVANPYPGVKICDIGGYNYASQWNYADSWYPNGVPTASDDVMILEGSPSIPDASYNRQVKSIVIGHGGDLYSPTVASSLNVIEGVETHSCRYNPRGVPNNALSIGATTTFTAQSVTIASECPMQVTGIANITTLNPGSANSVIVNDGGVLNATTITGTNGGANNKVVIKSGGQVKTENAFYGTIEKDITGYGAENVNGKAGWYLVATPTLVTVEHTFVPQSGSDYLFDQMDFYWFNGSADLEWVNAKCAMEDGCPGPNGNTIPQGQISAVLGQPKKGYLYARQNDGTVQMAAGPVGNAPFSATNVDTDVNLTCYTNPNDASLNGWNLIGNPYTCNAYLKQGSNYISFYKMNDAGNAIVGVPAGTPIKPCEGVFVRCTEPGSTVTFTTAESSVLGETPEDPMILLPTHVLYEDQDAGKMMEIILTEGWNWIAPTVEMSVEALQSVLGSDAVIQPEEGNTNATVAPGQMVKIHVDEDGAGAFTLLGRVVAANITIENGINWIGYTGGTTTNISTGLTSYGITPNIGDKIISQDNGFAIFNGTSWEGTLTLLEQGKGYVYVR